MVVPSSPSNHTAGWLRSSRNVEPGPMSNLTNSSAYTYGIALRLGHIHHLTSSPIGKCIRSRNRPRSRSLPLCFFFFKVQPFASCQHDEMRSKQQRQLVFRQDPLEARLTSFHPLSAEMRDPNRLLSSYSVRLTCLRTFGQKRTTIRPQRLPRFPRYSNTPQDS